nr:hypothetical protein [Desulfocapsaceae bacterium]
MTNLIILLHWRFFDLHFPLRMIRDFYQEDIEPRGLLCAEASGTPAEQELSFLGIPRISEIRLEFYRNCQRNLQDQYHLAGLELHHDNRPAQDVLNELALQHKRVDVWLPVHLGSEENNFLEQLRQGTPANVNFHHLEANSLL